MKVSTDRWSVGRYRGVIILWGMVVRGNVCNERIIHYVIGCHTTFVFYDYVFFIKYVLILWTFGVTLETCLLLECVSW